LTLGPSLLTGRTPPSVRLPAAELLIDCEEDRVLRAVLVGMLRERDRGRGDHLSHSIEANYGDQRMYAFSGGPRVRA